MLFDYMRFTRLAVFSIATSLSLLRIEIHLFTAYLTLILHSTSSLINYFLSMRTNPTVRFFYQQLLILHLRKNHTYDRLTCHITCSMTVKESC